MVKNEFNLGPFYGVIVTFRSKWPDRLGRHRLGFDVQTERRVMLCLVQNDRRYHLNHSIVVRSNIRRARLATRYVLTNQYLDGAEYMTRFMEAENFEKIKALGPRLGHNF